MSDKNQPSSQQQPGQNLPNIIIKVSRDTPESKPKGLTLPSSGSVRISSNDQAKWRCEDGKFKGHVEIRLSPKDTPFPGHRYESSIGRVIPSGKALINKGREAGPYKYLVIVTTHEGVLLSATGDLTVTD